MSVPPTIPQPVLSPDYRPPKRGPSRKLIALIAGGALLLVGGGTAAGLLIGGSHAAASPRATASAPRVSVPTPSVVAPDPAVLAQAWANVAESQVPGSANVVFTTYMNALSNVTSSTPPVTIMATLRGLVSSGPAYLAALRATPVPAALTVVKADYIKATQDVIQGAKDMILDTSNAEFNRGGTDWTNGVKLFQSAMKIWTATGLPSTDDS